MQHVLDEMIAHMMDFVEKDHPNFNGPVCPFAKEARENDKIYYSFQNLKTYNKVFEEEIIKFNQNNYEILWFIDPDKTTTYQQVEKLRKLILKFTKPMDLYLFSGHPNDPFTLNGVLTRQEPYPNLLIQKGEILRKYK